MSYKIIRMIISRLLPEYDYDSEFIENLYDNEKFLQLRKEYKALYGEYPVFLVEKYKTQVKMEPVPSLRRIRSGSKSDMDKRLEIILRNQEAISTVIHILLRELEEFV